MIGEPPEIRAEFECMFAGSPGQIIQNLYYLAALHAGIAGAGGHEAVDQHLRRL